MEFGLRARILRQSRAFGCVTTGRAALRDGAFGLASGMTQSLRVADHDARTASKHLTPFNFRDFPKRNGDRCFAQQDPAVS